MADEKQSCGAALEILHDSYKAQFVCEAPLGHDGPHGGSLTGGRMADRDVNAYLVWPYTPKHS